MRHKLWLAVVVASTALLVRFSLLERSDTDSVDGIALGMTKVELTAQLGGTWEPALMLEDSNTQYFEFSSGTLAIGNHPEEKPKDPTHVHTGLALDGGFPVVGFDAHDRVSWVCGKELVLAGRDASSPPAEGIAKLYVYQGRPAVPRSGYCMSGPWAFSCLGGKVEIFTGHTQPESDMSRLFLLKAGYD